MQTTRRQFLRTAALSAAALGLGVTACSGRKKPNVLFLFADDQRFNTIHALGNEQVISPTLDKLVKSGTTFTNAYIMGGNTGAICMPSRAMLMSGKTLAHLEDDGKSIPEDHMMMPEMFRLNGYTTFGTGKWHNGKKAYARCFDTGGNIMFGGMSDPWNVPCYDFDPNGKYDKRTPVIEDPWSSNKITLKNYDHITEGKHASELFADTAIDFIKQYDDEKPFFMYVPFTAPHDPRTMPQEYLDMYDPQQIDLPKNFMPEHPFDNGELKIRDEMLAGFPRSENEVKRHIADYYAMITHLDAQIARILEALKESKKFKNTIIIFSGDNGLAVGQHGLMGKQNIYEHSVHVPLVFSGKGIPKNEQRENFCYLSDIFPTLCDLLDMQIPSSVDGLSFVKAFDRKSFSARESVVFGYKRLQKGIRKDQWKYIAYHVNGIQHEQLFNLKKDPNELVNLADESRQQKRKEKLKAELQVLLNESGDPIEFLNANWYKE